MIFLIKRLRTQNDIFMEKLSTGTRNRFWINNDWARGSKWLFWIERL